MSRKFERAYFCNNIHPRISMQNVREMRAAQKADACHQNSKVTHYKSSATGHLTFFDGSFSVGPYFRAINIINTKSFFSKERI